jgi:hypothetical protein
MNKGLNGERYQQNQRVSFRFAEIASWQVGGGSFQPQRAPRVGSLLMSNRLNEEFYAQNQRVSFRFAEIAGWRVGGSSFQR